MFDDIYIFYVLGKYKLGIISRENLFSELKEYVKSKGQIFLKLLQIFLINQYLFGKEFTREEVGILNSILDNVHYKVENADFEVGSGSVAFVHYDLKDKSKVVKKNIPGIKQQIEKSTDEFRNMLYLASFKIKINVDENSIQDYKNLLLNQTKLDKEAKNMIRMKNILKYEYIKIPKVFEYNKDMIKMEYIEGYKLTDFLKKYPEQELNCKSLIQCMMKKMIDNKFIHGDLHEGNFLFNIDKNNNVILNLIDFGLVFELNEHQKKIFNNYLLFGTDRSLFFYEMSTKEIPFTEFDKYFEEYRHSDIYVIFEKMKENNVKFNFYYTTFIIGLNNLIIRLKKMKGDIDF